MTAILQVIPALESGGAERTVIEIAEALAARGWPALVASRGGAMEGELEAAGGRLIRMDAGTKSPFGLMRNALFLRRLIGRESVGLVHARSRAPAWSALWAAKAAQIPFITTYHGAYSGESALKRGYNGVMARGKIVIANSAYMRDQIVRAHDCPPDRIRVIPRGVDIARFSPEAVSAERRAAMRAGWGLAPDDARPVVLLPARLTYWKGHEIALEAFARLETEAVLVFAGGGAPEMRSALKASVAARGLVGRVVMGGHTADMPAAMAASDLVIAPSTRPEAFGRTAAEAQAMGVPVIAAGHGGALEVVQDGVTGWLVPPGDAGALAARIGAALAMTPEARARIGEAGRIRIAGHFTKAALQRATLAVYDEVLAA